MISTLTLPDILQNFVSKSGYEPKHFRGFSVEDLPVVEEIVQRNIFIYNFDIQEGEFVGELSIKHPSSKKRITSFISNLEVHFLDKMKNLDGATTLDSFLKT